jgi:fumarate hydratase class II
MAAVRVEKDSLGPKEVPAHALWGVQTQRAVENFPISGFKPYPWFVKGQAIIKRAAAEVNMALGYLDPKIGQAIVQAAQEVIDGKWMEHFVVDPFQAGAGTSHNMNTNEVIANRAIEILGGQRGDYKLVSPNDHVNMAQSTNDTIPTCIRIACLPPLDELIANVKMLEEALQAKAGEFDDIVKAGRTHLQDAVPVRLGQEFGAYARAIAYDRERLEQARQKLLRLGIGGTATGTGLNSDPRYHPEMVKKLSELTGYPFVSSGNLFESMQNMADFVELSGAMRTLAVNLDRIANDLRLMSSGPQTGLDEIRLPAVQPGSSIMPGKINPSIPEMLNMVCFQVMGNDVTIMLAAQAGQLELNVMMPVIAFDLLMSLDILKNAVKVFTEKCVRGIVANRERCAMWVENSFGLVTALNPYIGYLNAAEVVKEAQRTGKPVRQVVLEKGILTKEQLDEILSPRAMTEPGIPGKAKPGGGGG